MAGLEPTRIEQFGFDGRMQPSQIGEDRRDCRPGRGHREQPADMLAQWRGNFDCDGHDKISTICNCLFDQVPIFIESETERE